MYFYNPNIQPYLEHQKRLEAMQVFAEKSGVPLISSDEYDPEEWFRMTAFREKQRCRLCYAKRLESAARVARKGKFDAFTTTLFYSKQQKHEMIKELAEAIAEGNGVELLYRDFREGWKQGTEKSKEMGLYRQQYCGCIYSERDRYMGNKKPSGLKRRGD
jgi:epoxyqueuosine reductase